jgi:hypothetical protein
MMIPRIMPTMTKTTADWKHNADAFIVFLREIAKSESARPL